MSRRLTIVNVAYPFAPVTPGTPGGAEQVVSALDAALVAAGHASVVVAARGSRVAGTLMATDVPDGPLDEATREEVRRRHRASVAAAVARFAPDLVHLHGVDFPAYLPPPGVPALVTLHLPPSWYAAGALAPARPATFLQCVSATQRRAVPPGIPLLPEIPNGVDLARFRPRGRPRGFALHLARVCPEKGTHLAIEAARRAGVPLAVGGSVFAYPEHAAYFAREVAPRLDRRRRFLGPIPPARKARLLAAARCLLVPSLCEETSSLAAMEALASGTPVVAFRRGALTQIVEDGVTGFLVEGVGEMAEAIARAASLDRRACRRAAEERFDLARVLRATLARYAELAALRRAA